ncbi:protein EDS1L-like [Vicia villosa]|uniref:protein EDS1L-like n=1 Tax=Vicia villosa TaxID=3911 RepID=UPI00273CB90B|nr:protein EDS1L-like [Vicia villosa]
MGSIIKVEAAVNDKEFHYDGNFAIPRKPPDSPLLRVYNADTLLHSKHIDSNLKKKQQQSKTQTINLQRAQVFFHTHTKFAKIDGLLQLSLPFDPGPLLLPPSITTMILALFAYNYSVHGTDIFNTYCQINYLNSASKVFDQMPNRDFIFLYLPKETIITSNTSLQHVGKMTTNTFSVMLLTNFIFLFDPGGTHGLFLFDLGGTHGLANLLLNYDEEVKKGMAEGKQVVFTGHSSGAVLAILVTFWALEENLNQIQHKSPMCVTFGSPLVGNHIFSHASNRQNWSRRFVHFVMIYDIVPRIFLAPFSSIEKILSPALQLLTPDDNNFESQDSIRESLSCEFYSTVMRNAAAVTRHVACNLMGNTNLLLETMTNFVELSPYRPFGTYIFCNGNGQLIVVNNSDAVLQLMFHIAQLKDSTQLSEVANKSLLQHLAYEAELEESLGMQNVVHLNKLDDLPLSSGDALNTDIAAALDSLGLSVRARLCLRAAGELEKQKERNEEKIKKEIQEKAVPSMRYLEEYKATCEINKGKGYYDSFKVQTETKDFQANVKRLELTGVWDLGGQLKVCTKVWLSKFKQWDPGKINVAITI